MTEKGFTPEQARILNAFLRGVLFHAQLDDLVEVDSDVAWARFGKTVFKTAQHYQARVNAAGEVQS